MVRKSSFWESAKIFKDELKYLGYHKTFIFKTGNKNVLWFQYPGATVRNYKILGIPKSLHRGVPLPPPYVQGRIDSWKCCFFFGRGENRSIRGKLLGAWTRTNTRIPTQTDKWSRRRDLNPCHSGGRRLLSKLRNPIVELIKFRLTLCGQRLLPFLARDY